MKGNITTGVLLLLLLTPATTLNNNNNSNNNNSNNSNDCSVWFLYNTTTASCECGDRYSGVVRCSNKKQCVSVLRCYRMTHSDTYNTTVVGHALDACRSDRHRNKLYNSALCCRDTTELDREVCGRFNRTGQHCGSCLPGFVLSVILLSESLCTLL